MLLRSSLFLFIFFQCTQARFHKSNVTDFSKCNVYYSRSGSLYKDFFEINEEPQNGSLLDFHFSVMSLSDAHILLAPSANIEKGDPVYEIVIGAGGNTFCDIRRMQKSGVKATIRIKGLLSALDPQSFWIHIGKDGVIDVGKEGEELGILSWTDPDPLPLKVFSFSTWPGVEAKWFFDCKRENETSSSKKIEKPLAPLEKLRKDLLFFYDPYVRPVRNASDITVVGLRLAPNIVNLDEHKSVLQFSGVVKINWKDEKLRWDPSNYSGIDSLHIFRREIWVPDLYLFNSVAEGSNILEDTMLTANYTGHVEWTTNINTNSWCSPEDLGRWPRDQHSCDIVLGFFKEFQNLQLVFNESKNSFKCCPYTSRWQVLKVESYSNKGWANASERNFNNFDPPGLTFNVKLKRTSESYGIILFTPFFFIAGSLLATFWVSPFGFLKMFLACLQLVLCSIVMIVLGLMIPIRSQLVPNIVLLYSYSLVATVVCIVIETIVINFSRTDRKNSLPHVLTKIILSISLKMFLCLPDIKSSEEYGNLNDSSFNLNDNQQTMWILLGVAIDRIAFFVYLGLAVYAFCVTYY